MILLNLTKYEELAQELFDFNIALYEQPLNTVDAFCTKVDKKTYICINENKHFNNFDKYWITEHELEHIKNNAFYSVQNTKAYIRKREYKTNDAIVEKFDLATSTLSLLKQGLEKWEICEILEIPYDLYDHILNYISRKNIFNFY